jgi:hypothetical protein
MVGNSGVLVSERTDRRVSRRSVTRGAVWTAPIIAVATAAPAFATSPPRCVVQTNFDNLTPGTTPSVLTFLPSTVTATVAYAANYGSDNTPGRTGQVGATTTTPVWNYIEVEMLSPITAGHTVTVTLSLSAPVTNLAFKIHDIDTVSGQWLDQVVVSTPGYTAAKGANVTGAGTSGSPFTNTTQVDNPISSGLGDVELKWAGPISQVKFVYRAGSDGSSGNQHVGIGNISFTDCVATSDSRVAVQPGREVVSKGLFSPGRRGDLDPARDN